MAVAMLLVAGAGCKRRGVETDEEAPRMASAVSMNDARTAGQLISGFYGIESNAWRWTAQKFTVALRTPAGAQTKGAKLVFHLAVPEATLAQLHAVTLTAHIGGITLPSETYAKSDSYTYERSVPATAFEGDTTRVAFELDKAVPPGPVDHRELGIIAQSIALSPAAPAK